MRRTSSMASGFPQVSTTVRDASILARSAPPSTDAGRRGGVARSRAVAAGAVSTPGGTRLGERFLLAQGQAENLPKEVARPARAERGVARRPRPAHRRHVEEVEAARGGDPRELLVEGELGRGAVREEEGDRPGDRAALEGVVVELANHRGERGKACARRDHQHVRHAVRPAGESEVTGRALDVRQGAAHALLGLEQGLREPAESVGDLEDDKELQLAVAGRLEGSGRDRVGVCHRPALLPAPLVEVGHVARAPVRPRDAAGQPAALAPQRDVLAGGIGGEAQGSLRRQPKARQRGRQLLPGRDGPAPHLGH